MPERHQHQPHTADHQYPRAVRRRRELPLNLNRRNILKFGALGVGTFILGKIFGPSINLFGGSFDGDIYNFKNFRVVENGKELGFFDRLGNEILVLEKDPDSGK